MLTLERTMFTLFNLPFRAYKRFFGLLQKRILYIFARPRLLLLSLKSAATSFYCKYITCFNLLTATFVAVRWHLPRSRPCPPFSFSPRPCLQWFCGLVRNNVLYGHLQCHSRGDLRNHFSGAMSFTAIPWFPPRGCSPLPVPLLPWPHSLRHAPLPFVWSQLLRHPQRLSLIIPWPCLQRPPLLSSRPMYVPPKTKNSQVPY